MCERGETSKGEGLISHQLTNRVMTIHAGLGKHHSHAGKSYHRPDLRRDMNEILHKEEALYYPLELFPDGFSL
jgi:hypothetical protein